MTRRDLLLAAAAAPQRAPEPAWRVTVPLVFAPASVLDRSGRPVAGLAASDFLLLDDGRPLAVRIEETGMPVSLVLAVQATLEARKALHKLRGAAGLWAPLVAGEGAEAALLAVRDDFETVQQFTSDVDRIAAALRQLEARGQGWSFVDAVVHSASLLAVRPPGLRRVLVVIGESRDRTSEAPVDHAIAAVQRANVTVFALSWSPALMDFGREVPVAP